LIDAGLISDLNATIDLFAGVDNKALSIWIPAPALRGKMRYTLALREASVNWHFIPFS